MSPVAVPLNSTDTASPEGPTLVIGSPTTAQDGSYQAAVLDVAISGTVEKQMVDRILDEATNLKEVHYAAAIVVLAAQDYSTVDVGKLITLVAAALEPLATITFFGISTSSDTATASLLPALARAGLVALTSESDSGRTVSVSEEYGPTLTAPTPNASNVNVVAQKPLPSSSSSSIPLSTTTTSTMSTTTTTTTTTTVTSTKAPTAAAMPLFRRGKSDKSTKKALWSLNSAPSTPPVDASSLLTAEDLVRPVPTCEPAVAGAPRRKKACKGCTCGLAEIEADEVSERQKKLVVLLDGDVQEIESAATVVVKTSVAKTTSSCGSCYLGDAFRCASCPYLGLPAFEPGQKVEIDFGSDDI